MEHYTEGRVWSKEHKAWVFPSKEAVKPHGSEERASTSEGLWDARGSLRVLLEEFYENATLTKQGTHVYSGFEEIVEDMDYDISKFIKEHCPND